MEWYKAIFCPTPTSSNTEPLDARGVAATVHVIKVSPNQKCEFYQDIEKYPLPPIY